MKSRRTALKTIAAVACVPALEAQHHHEDPPVTIAPPKTAKFFSKPDFDLLTRLVDLIIPRTDTPGAADAGVPFYIDDAIAYNHNLKAEFAAGLKSFPLDFLESPEARQIEILKSKAEDAFFTTLKNLTIDGYYSSREGLVQELGYHGNTFLASFPGCTHPEHQS